MAYVPQIYATADRSKTLGAATATKVLENNILRRGAVFVNDSSDTVYLSLGAIAAVNKGIRLNAAGGAFEINATNLFRGEVWAYNTSGGVLCIMEYS